ncbi:MAG: A24 family peptidase [Thermoflexaceae bacterium]|nr:A24 family peptidase [Thermoflexaceae bacterium]
MTKAVIYILIFLIGLFFGETANLLIDRLPEKDSKLFKRSHCTKCGSDIKWYDSIPLVSYIFLLGRCRHCEAKISLQYPVIDLVNGAGYILVCMVNGVNVLSALYCLAFTILLVIAVIDWRTYEIPPSLNLMLGCLGVIRIILDFSHLLDYLIGFCVVSGFLYLLVLATHGRGMGGGDVKLMAAAGLFIGWKNIILALALGSILGSIIHIVLMTTCSKDRVLAFGPYLSAGIVIAMLYGDQLISWYIGLL